MMFAIALCYNRNNLGLINTRLATHVENSIRHNIQILSRSKRIIKEITFKRNGRNKSLINKSKDK